jgi:hypothetical protein
MSKINQDDPIFQALACMGNATEKMSWANNWLEDVTEVPKEIKVEMIGINTTIHCLQEQLREVRKAMNKDDHDKPDAHNQECNVCEEVKPELFNYQNELICTECIVTNSPSGE